jgi:hypothetical protein
MGIAAADSAATVYYSIHLASFEDLRNANAYVNALKNKEKVVFWKKTDVPEKGLLYRVYLGKYENRKQALEFWDKLKKDGAVSYLGIHEFRETMEGIVKEEPAVKGELEETDGDQVGVSSQKRNRFVDNKDGTITDTTTNLMWVKNGWSMDFFAALTWRDANNRCREFRHGGYDNWRLPTVQEWKSVIDTTKECPALVEPNPFENVIVHMPYWSKSEFTFGAEHTCNTACPIYAYAVMLYFGKISHQNKNKRAFVFPVRSMN